MKTKTTIQESATKTITIQTTNDLSPTSISVELEKQPLGWKVIGGDVIDCDGDNITIPNTDELRHLLYISRFLTLTIPKILKEMDHILK